MEQGNNTESMVARLRTFHVADRGEQLVDAFARRIEDPLRPKTDTKSFRAKPILLLLAALAAATAGTFLFFTLAQL
jgi:hypothetical protein